jgi:hypothetical protein
MKGNMTTLTRIALVISLALGTFSLAANAQPVAAPKPTNTTTATTTTTTTIPPQQYTYGDCTWVGAVALQAGWEQHQLPRLTSIIERESGCCPNVRGGDVVNSDCEVVRVATMSHRSDSGLLQINGVHWKQDHAQYHGLVCKRMGVCTQEPLLDPLTNLTAGRLLFDVAGWSPWSLNHTKP